MVIDKDLFHERLSSLLTQWKTDKRSGDASFFGVGSIAACVGKANEGHYTKSAALQVGYVQLMYKESDADITTIAMAVRLRVPLYSLSFHSREHSHCHDEEEGGIPGAFEKWQGAC